MFKGLSSVCLARRIQGVASNTGILTGKRFADFGIRESLVSALNNKLGATRATEIQAKSFKSILEGKDVTLCSETGSGKTLAYLLPLVERILRLKSMEPSSGGGIDLLGRSSPPVVVLCPTSDLCNQVLHVTKSLDQTRTVSKQFLGAPRDLDLGSEDILVGPRIRWGAVDLVVSTPAKFLEDMNRFKQDKLMPSTIIFDEADFMLHGSTNEAIVEILRYIRPPPNSKTRQSLFCQSVFVSATMPDIGKKTIGAMLVQKFMNSEVIETVKFHSIPKSIDSIEFVPELDGDWNQRCYMLTQELAKCTDDQKRVLVFVNTQRNASILYQFLKDKKWPVELFVAGRSRQELNVEDPGIVIATDVGARGIDWNGGVDVVINFQMPTDIVAWIHRAGRCGRLGRVGRVVSFYKKQEEELVDMLKKQLDFGDKLDGLFSRKRSLRKRLRSNPKIDRPPS